ncbi:hypothetical protein RCL1_003937 [Eukaryota sp. TZLM3-RCL]
MNTLDTYNEFHVPFVEEDPNSSSDCDSAKPPVISSSVTTPSPLNSSKPISYITTDPFRGDSPIDRKSKLALRKELEDQILENQKKKSPLRPASQSSPITHSATSPSIPLSPISPSSQCSKLQARLELQQQMEAVKQRKEQEKKQLEEYNRKKEREMELYFPFPSPKKQTSPLIPVPVLPATPLKNQRQKDGVISPQSFNSPSSPTHSKRTSFMFGLAELRRGGLDEEEIKRQHEEKEKRRRELEEQIEESKRRKEVEKKKQSDFDWRKEREMAGFDPFSKAKVNTNLDSNILIKKEDTGGSVKAHSLQSDPNIVVNCDDSLQIKTSPSKTQVTGSNSSSGAINESPKIDEKELRRLELQQQIDEKNERKELEKLKIQDYDRKKELEILNYDPFSEKKTVKDSPTTPPQDSQPTLQPTTLPNLEETTSPLVEPQLPPKELSSTTEEGLIELPIESAMVAVEKFDDRRDSVQSIDSLTELKLQILEYEAENLQRIGLLQDCFDGFNGLDHGISDDLDTCSEFVTIE